MKIFKVLCLAACFLLGQPAVHSGTHYISLGRDCQVAGQLTWACLRVEPYPLDWMASQNFHGVMQVFKDDFKYFLDPAFLVYKTFYIENVYYQFIFNHFFSIVGQPITEDVCAAGTVVPNYLDYLPAVRTTQGRRIQRLLNLLSSNEKIVFIRTHATPAEAAAFMNMLKGKYPKLDAVLVVVHGKKDLIGDWNIPNVLNFYASQRSGLADWWTQAEWLNIFHQVQNWLNQQVILQGNK